MGWLAERRAQSRVAVAAAEYEAARLAIAKEQLTAHHTVLMEATNAFQYNPSNLFDPELFVSADGIDESRDREMLRRCHKLAKTNPYVGGWIELFVKWIIGQGVTVTIPSNNQKAKDIIKEFRAGESGPYRNQQPGQLLEAESVRRLLRDGRLGIRKFPSSDGKHYTRFLNPVLLGNDGSVGQRGEFGIVTQENDVQVIEQFIYHPYGHETFKTTNGPVEYIPGEEVIWHKLGDSDEKRGNPCIVGVLQYLSYYDKLMWARLKLNYLRSLCYKEETYEGLSKAQIEKIHENLKAAETGASSTFEKVPVSGSVERHGSNVHVEYKTPNLQNSDAQVEFSILGRAFAVWFGLPTGIVMADEEQETYRGGEIGERRTERCIEFWQYVQVAPYLKRHYEAVLETAKMAGTYDGPTEVEIDMPLVNPKDIIKETQAMIVQATTVLPDGRPVASAQTTRAKLGHDSATEIALADKEREQAPEPPVAVAEELLAEMGRTRQNAGSREGREAVRRNEKVRA
jgi:hypothetical protein